ncbi:MAG: hypothetical protein M3Y81_04895 [Chloroflexota bacterium]|nr:hypothetical protein [Chloroflexota bacterium]
MPPDLDIYGLTKNRDAITINRFLDTYVDRAASNDRGDEELLMEPLLPTQPGTGFDAFESEPALTLSHIIDRGLAFPRRAFTVYLTPRRADLTKVILSFTADDQLVLGVSLDDEGAIPENEKSARDILAQLVEEYGCHIGLILVESPPPRSETAFYARAKQPLVIFFGTLLENPPT